MNREKLIKHYEENLEKVKQQFQGDWRFQHYIEFAKNELKAVKNGRKW
jgi:hypothetical protein